MAAGNNGEVQRRAATSAQLLKLVRKIHLYLGLFIAPALLFFAFTGAIQTLSLHESAGSSYTPPDWLARLGQLHKNQNIHLRKRQTPGPVSRIAPTGASAAPKAPEPGLAAKQRQHLPEKLFFLLVCLGLCSSTLTGIFLAYRYERGKLLLSALLAAGIVVPLLLLPF